MQRRRLSRWMPAAPSEPATWKGWAAMGCLGLGLLGLAYGYVEVRIVLAVLAGLVVVEGFVRSRRMRRRAAERRGESICTFARTFPRRSVDPWIIRAVHQALQPYAMAGDVPVPLRATDRLDRDIGIVDEDVDDVAVQVAARAGRSLDDTGRNPVRRVETVGDLVRFLAHQPRTADA